MPPKDKLELYERHGIGGIVRMERDGSKREVYATGVRNSVGITYHPTTKELWFTDNQSTVWATTRRQARSIVHPRPE